MTNINWVDFAWLQWGLVAAAVIVAIFSAMEIYRSWYKSYWREQAQKGEEGRDTEYFAWREAVKAHGGYQPVFCPMHLDEGERCYSFDHAVSMYLPSEPHEHTSEGVLFDTEPGQPVGGGWSIMDSFDDVQFVGRGRLCVTDRCISFGDLNSRQEIQIDDVRIVAASRSCLLVGTEQMDRPMLFTNVNGQRLRDVIHYVINGLESDGD